MVTIDARPGQILRLDVPPPDQISFTNGRIVGETFAMYPTRTTARISFDTNLRHKLDPFKYQKPEINLADPFAPPTNIIEETEPREGYYLVAVVRNLIRPPNHLYNPGDAIITARNFGTREKQDWQLRYFPKDNINPEAWAQAQSMEFK